MIVTYWITIGLFLNLVNHMFLPKNFFSVLIKNSRDHLSENKKWVGNLIVHVTYTITLIFLTIFWFLQLKEFYYNIKSLF